MKSFFISLLILGGLSTSTFGQYEALPQNYDWSKSILIQDETIPLKNPNTATRISVGSTIGSYLFYNVLQYSASESIFLYSVASLSIFVSPALGYLYTNNWGDFWSSVTRRFLGMLVATAGVVIIVNFLESTSLDENFIYNPRFIGGAGLMLGGTIYTATIIFRDFRQVRTRVHEYNEGLTQSVQIMPTIDPVNKSIGLGFRVNF